MKQTEHPNESRCQCIATCYNPPLKGEAFCKEHMKFCPRRAPTNGYEPPYEPEKWNKSIIKRVYNCFAYAFNKKEKEQEERCKNPNCYVPFYQPGSISGYPPISQTTTKTCPNMIARTMGDNIVIPSAFELKCPAHMSKIFLMVDPKQDYHFVRQDMPYGTANNVRKTRSSRNNKDIGYFSGKSGGLAVTNLDAKGHKIFDPELANFNYSNIQDDLHYTEFCGYFCVSRKHVYAAIGGKYGKTRRKSKQVKPLSQ